MGYLQKIALQAEIETVGITPIKILTFPEARQATNFSCGAAAVQAVLYYYGIDLREDNIIKALKSKPTETLRSGIEPDVLKKALEGQWKLTVDMRDKMSIDDVKGYIDNDIPVILAIQAWRGSADGVDYSKRYDDGHYVVAIGYSDRHLLFNDPSILSNRGYLLFEDLEQRWHDIDRLGNKLEQLGLAIYGRLPVFNPNSFKKIL